MSITQSPAPIIWLTTLTADEAGAAAEILEGVDVAADHNCRGAEWVRREIADLAASVRQQQSRQMERATRADH